MIVKKLGVGTLLLVMFLVGIAFMPTASAEKATNVAENVKNGDIGILMLVKTVPISGDLNPTAETDTFSFTVPSGQGWDRVSADVTVSSIHALDTSGDISIELLNPSGTKVAGDTLYGTETHLDFNYDPGYDLTAGSWRVRVKGVDLNGHPGYDGGAYI
jgi:hypothetical protein